MTDPTDHGAYGACLILRIRHDHVDSPHDSKLQAYGLYAKHKIINYVYKIHRTLLT
jgi:hypothetical protein